MRRLRYFKTLLILFAISAGTFAIHIYSNRSEIDQASINPNNEILIRTAKMLPSTAIKIEKISQNDVAVGEEFTLKARIQTRVNITNVSYKWVLPNGVRLVSGHETGTILNLSVKEEVAIEATFISDTNTNEKIHFQVADSNSAQNTSASQTYQTLAQSGIDFEKSEIARRQREYLEENPEQVKRYK